MFKDASIPLLRQQQYQMGPHTHVKRFVDREGYFQQSLGKYNIRRTGANRHHLYFADIFHTVINLPTPRIIAGLAILYTLAVWIFAMLYYLIPDYCHVGVTSMVQAWLFSLETIMTIGYGAAENDIFFGDCYSMAFLLTIEAFSGIVLDAFCIGVFFARLSRGQTRANTIAFTSFAIIRKIDDHFYLCFKTCERRKHQLVEAHVRCYAICHEYNTDGEIVGEPFRTYQMRLTQPDDDIGASLLMVLPQEIIHRIDPWSPLYPYKERENPVHDPKRYGQRYPDPPQRAIDAENGNRDGNEQKPPARTPLQKDIEEHLIKSQLEIVVVLEGIDPPTSATIQARHSFIYENILWNHDFMPCVTRDPSTGAAVVDFDRFYQVISNQIDVHCGDKTP